MPDVQAAITRLQANWINLHDLDRGQAVAEIQRAGASIRQIAAGLKFSEATLRHLLWTLRASAEDKQIARNTPMSTNELVRRAKTFIAQQRQRVERQCEQRRAQDATKAAAQINKRLEDTHLHGPSCEQIVDVVRREFAERELDGSLPPHDLEPIPALSELIARCRPKRPCEDNAGSTSW